MWTLAKSAIKYHVKHSIQHMILHVTNICNLRCKTCFVEFAKKPADLTLDEFQKLHDEVGPVSMMNFSGGEPFIRKDLVEITRVFSDSDVLAIPTNGWWTDRIYSNVNEILEHRDPSTFTLIFSLDGFEETHDEIRGPKSYEKAIETLKLLLEIPELRIQVNTVLCERNAPEIIDFMKFVREFNTSYHSILLLRGDPADDAYRLPDYEVIDEIKPKAFEIFESYGYGVGRMAGWVSKNYQEYIWDLSIQTMQEERQIIPCLGGQAHVVVYANGDVAPCELLPVVGNIRNQSYQEILGSDPWQDSVKSIQRNGCFCTHNCNMVENVLFNPKTYPKLIGISKSA